LCRRFSALAEQSKDLKVWVDKEVQVLSLKTFWVAITIAIAGSITVLTVIFVITVFDMLTYIIMNFFVDPYYASSSSFF
jgi:hypothetical protein